MLTIFVTTVTVLILALFALMAIVPFMLESQSSKGELPDNVVQFGYQRQSGQDNDRPAA